MLLALTLCLHAVAQKKPAPAAPRSKSTPKSAPKVALSAERKGYPIVELVTSGSERYDAEDILKTTGLAQSKTVDTPLDDVKAAA